MRSSNEGLKWLRWQTAYRWYGSVPTRRAKDLCLLRRHNLVMDRAFGSFEECVQDGVMSACGGYDTAPLDRIYSCIEQRMEKYFDQAGNVVALAQAREWKLNVRRALFTSSRFGVEKVEHNEQLEFFVVDKRQHWFLYPATTHRKASHSVLQESLHDTKSKRVEIEPRIHQGHPNAHTKDEDRTRHSSQTGERSCKTRSSSGNSEDLLTTKISNGVKDKSVSETTSTAKTDSLYATSEQDDLTSEEVMRSGREKIQKEGPHAFEHDKKVEEINGIEQSQQVSYKTELTYHTLCSNLEIGSFPGSLPF